jgi:glycosyltransferase involved in cell wall biosynthesis
MRETTTPDLSVVLCTRNRGAQLKASLEHLSCLRSADSWELVIVDNGSSDDTPDILTRYQAAATFPVVLVHEPRPGLGGARNAGVAASRGDIIAFTDDDCYPKPDWLTHIRHAFTDERVGYMGGRILLYDPADAPIAIRTSTVAEWIRPHSLLRAGCIQGANMAVRREVFESAGVFDPLFGSGTSLIADDIEFLARVSAVGWSGLYSPDAVVYHHHRRSHSDMDGRRRLYSQGIGAYHAKLLLRGETRMLGLRHWAASLRRHDLRTFARECNGAAQYALNRAAVAFRGSGH